MKRRAVLAAAAVLTLAACAPTSGIVIAKNHRPMLVTMAGKTPVIIPERWTITVQDATGRKGDVSVEEAQWNEITVGDHWEETP